MILVSGSSKEKYCKAHTCKSILHFRTFNSGSQMPMLYFVSLKEKTIIISGFSFLLGLWFVFFLLLLKELDCIYYSSEPGNVSKLIEINSFH